nr:MAG: hypothetical protein DIU80_00725 [Chloroflexota bacterium]
MGLTPRPLIRLPSLSMPLIRVPQVAWDPIVSLPLFLATWLIIRYLRLSRRQLGLQTGDIVSQLMIASGGISLGVFEYMILKPEMPLVPFTWPAFLLATLVLLVATGFAEELIFRGVLQTLAFPALGRYALVYVSLLFAVLHIGYLSLVDVAFVFVVGMVFAYIVAWSGSILGVTLAHGLTNTVLFLVMPYAAQNISAELNQALPWLSAISLTLSLGTVVRLGWRARAGAGAPKAVPSASPLPALPQRGSQGAPAAPSRIAGLTAEGELDLYQRLTGDFAEPLLRVRVEEAGLRAVLFVSTRRLPVADRLQVYVGGALAPDLGVRFLPPQYGFVAGVVELDALPDAALARVGALHRASRLLTRSLRGHLDDLGRSRPEEFQAFWAAYGGYFGVGPWAQRLEVQAAG